MEQAFHAMHIDNDDDQILIASWNPTRNAPYHCYRLVVPEYVKTRKTDLINNEIRDSCNKSACRKECAFCSPLPICEGRLSCQNEGVVF